METPGQRGIVIDLIRVPISVARGTRAVANLRKPRNERLGRSSPRNPPQRRVRRSRIDGCARHAAHPSSVESNPDRVDQSRTKNMAFFEDNKLALRQVVVLNLPQ